MMIGIGTDIVEIARVRKVVEKASFLKVLTKGERIIFDTLQGVRREQWLAGRFAAKEAIYKAVNEQYPCVIADIEILSDTKGAPICCYQGLSIQISISHEKEYAVAFAIASTKE